MIRLEACSFSYGDQSIFKNVNLSLQAGKYFVIGQNGLGKTTFLHILGGWKKVSGISGDIGSVSFLPTQYQVNPHLKIIDLVEIYGLDWKIFSASKIFISFKLSHFAMNAVISELSSGELQRLLLSLVLSQKNDTLILDEPFNHLDWWAKKQLINHLKNTNYKYMLITTHDFQIPLQFEDANFLLIDKKSIHDLGLCREALISEKFQNSFHFQTQIIDNPIDRSSILAIAEKHE
ncbi:MAG: ABC transporter ATP-binding protein [Bdellovibrionales bacterium]|nr:ABC transporter ATP-binding protein [Bdellovibrionales bacterium]